jgi:putative ABC transport system permease protein
MVARGGALEASLLRAYRGLLLLYPAEFRAEYGRELCLVLVDRVREERSRARTLGVWFQAALAVLVAAPREHLHVTVQDLRHAARVMRKDRLATATGISVLALGIGAATLVFSLVSGVLVRPLPYADAERLVAVEEYHPLHAPRGMGVAFPNYQDLRARARTLDELAVFTEGQATLRGEGEAEVVPAGFVSDGLFPVLGVPPLMGRVFTAAEDVPKGPRVVVLGEELWRRRHGGDPDVIGKTVGVGSDRYEVIGVMPASFHFPERALLWMPLQLSPADAKRTDHFLEGVGRLRPGVDVAQATDELASLMSQINAENPGTDYANTARAVPLRRHAAGDYRLASLTLLGGVFFLLLIACASVANLLLVKASVRAREMAIRTALGASRGRLVRQLVAESVLLGLVGGAVGTALATALLPVVVTLVPVELPRWMAFQMDGRVLGFAVGLSLATSLLFGLVPALGLARADVGGTLQEGGRGRTGGVVAQRVRQILVVAEVALSLLLLAAAGLMLRSFVSMRTQALGFEPRSVLTLRLATPDRRYPPGPQARALVQRLRDEVQALPGVRSVAFASNVPLGGTWGRSLTVEGYPVLPLKDAPMINHTVATPGYFRTLGIPLLEGRDFTDADWDNPRVTVVDRSIAARYWPGESAIGKRVRFGPPEANEPWHTIVGVVGDVRSQDLARTGRWDVYIPFAEGFSPSLAVAVRTSGDPLRQAAGVRARIVAVDRDVAVSQVRSLVQVVDRAAWRERFVAVLLAVFAGAALVLTAVGLYGVLAYAVSLRSREIGIRMALGASARAVRSMVARQGLRLTVLGLALGTLGAAALGRLLASQLHHVSPADPATYLGVLLLLAIVAGLAIYVPARRATRVDPVVTLRQE